MKSVDVLKAGLVRHREDDEEAVPRPHVLLPHRAELLLAGCVQHCKDGHKTVAGVKEFRAVCSHLQLHIAAVLRSKSPVVMDVSFFYDYFIVACNKFPQSGVLVFGPRAVPLCNAVNLISKMTARKTHNFPDLKQVPVQFVQLR